MSRKALLKHMRNTHPGYVYNAKGGRPKVKKIDNVEDMYAGPASYLFIEQEEEKRPVGRPRKRKETRGRPKKIE